MNIRVYVNNMLVNSRSIEPNSNMIRAILDMAPFKTVKDV